MTTAPHREQRFAASGPCPGELLHPVQQLLLGVVAELDAVPGDPQLWRLGAGEADAVLAGLVRARDRLDVLALTVVDHQVQAARPAASGAASPSAWLARLTSANRAAAARTVGWAATLGDAARDPVTAPLVADARSGTAPVEQVVLALRAVAALPTDLGAALRARAAAVMRAHAAAFDPAAVRALGERLVAVVDPEQGERRLAEQLDRAERDAHALRSLVLRPAVAGLVTGRFALTALDAAQLAAALESLAAPAHLPHPAPAAAADTAAGSAGADDGGDSVFGPPASPEEPPRDSRTRPQRMADALVELARRALLAGDLPVTGGQRPQVVVTVDWDVLRNRAGAATTPDTGAGVPLGPRDLRRAACDAGVRPGRPGRGLPAPRHRNDHPGGAHRAPPGPGRPGRRVCLPRLLASARCLRRPPPAPLGGRRPHGAVEPGAAVRASPPGGPQPRLAAPDGRGRSPRVAAAAVGRRSRHPVAERHPPDACRDRATTARPRGVSARQLQPRELSTSR